MKNKKQLTNETKNSCRLTLVLVAARILLGICLRKYEASVLSLDADARNPPAELSDDDVIQAVVTNTMKIII
jgi:hypothetical protein